MMSKKEHTTKLVDEKSGLMECLVCGEKYRTTMKPGAVVKSLPEDWQFMNKCRLIPKTKKTIAEEIILFVPTGSKGDSFYRLIIYN